VFTAEYRSESTSKSRSSGEMEVEFEVGERFHGISPRDLWLKLRLLEMGKIMGEMNSEKHWRNRRIPPDIGPSSLC